MHEPRSTVQLAEEAPFDLATRGVTATLRRSDIEEAARAGDAPAELQLDVRWGEGALEEARALAVEWSQADLDRLLAATTSDEVTIAFDGDEMAAAINAEADVEAHGLRERAIVLTVVAVSALSTAGIAQAHPMGSPGGGAPATSIGGAVADSSIAPVTSPATTIGGAGVTAEAPATSPATTIGGAGPAPASPQVPIRGDSGARTAHSGGGSSLSVGEDVLLVGGAGLAIAAAGFAAAGTRRKTVRPA
jgi:hypothetical protein